MAHYKGAYVTNLNEFINSSYQRYHHKRYIQQLQYLLKLHQRNRRCNNNKVNNMAPSSVHPVNRNTTHHTSNHVSASANNPNATGASNNTSAAQAATHQQTSHLRKMVTFQLPPSANNNDTLHQRTRSAPPLYRSISESSLINCSTISDEQNEMPIQLRNQRNLPQKPLNKHPMSPTLPIAKLRLFKELNLKEKDIQQQNSLSRNSTMYNLNNINNMNNYNNSTGGPQQRNAMYDPRYPQFNDQQFGQPIGFSRYSHSLPNSPSKRPMYNQNYNLNHQLNQRHLSSMPSYQPVDCYTVGVNGMLSSHGSRFPLGTIPPMNSTSPQYNINSISPQTSSLPTYSQITKPSFLDINNPYSSHRTGLYNPLLFDKTLQRLKQRIPVCKSTPLSSIMANSLPSTNPFTTHDVTGLPRRRHASHGLTKSNLSPKTNLTTGQLNKSLITDGSIPIEQEDSPLTQMRKEIKYFVDERKRQLEQGALDVNNLNHLNSLASAGHLNVPGGRYLGSNSNLSNSTAMFNDQSPLSAMNLLHTSPNLTSTNLAQNRNNYLSSSESDLNALLNLYSYPPDPVLERGIPPAGTSVFQRLPQCYMNRSKNRFTVDDLRRRRHPLLDNYYDENLFNQYYGSNQQYYGDPLLDRNYYQNQLLPTSSNYQSLIDWPNSAYTTYLSDNPTGRPGYYASTGSLRTPTGLTGLSNNLSTLNAYNRSDLIGGANNAYSSNNYRLYDQNLLGDTSYLPNDYHHYSLDTLGLDRTAYSRPSSPYYAQHSSISTVPPPAPVDHYTQHSLSTNHLDSLDLNNNYLGKQTSTLRSYRL